MPPAHSSAPPNDAPAAQSPKAGSARHLRIAIFGFGTVGSSVARILIESKPQGLELTHIFNRKVARKQVDWLPTSVIWSEDAEAVLASNVDVIVELAGGLDPAGTHNDPPRTAFAESSPALPVTITSASAPINMSERSSSGAVEAFGANSQDSTSISSVSRSGVCFDGFAGDKASSGQVSFG